MLLPSFPFFVLLAYEESIMWPLWEVQGQWHQSWGQLSCPPCFQRTGCWHLAPENARSPVESMPGCPDVCSSSWKSVCPVQWRDLGGQGQWCCRTPCVLFFYFLQPSCWTGWSRKAQWTLEPGQASRSILSCLWPSRKQRLGCEQPKSSWCQVTEAVLTRW